MSPHRSPVNRTLAGVLAVVCGVAGTALWFGWPGQEAMAAGCIRVGLLLGALWLALPTRTRPAAWANVSPYVVVGVVVALLFVRQMRIFIPLLIVVGILGLLLRPRPKRPPSH